jgi:U4/U6.U5 tri-snRNP-associated protein 2
MTWKIHTRAGHVAVEEGERGAGAAANGKGKQATPEEKWFEMQDLRVEEVRKEMVFLGETVLQVWERRDLAAGGA